jgi:hypothetical protein
MYRTTRSFNVGQNMNEDAFFGMDEAMSEAVFSSDLPEEARASSPVLGEKDPKLVALGSEDLASDDDDDGEWVPEETRRKTRCTDEEKALEVLDSLSDHFPLRKFLHILFTSNDTKLNHARSCYFRHGWHCKLIGTWWEELHQTDDELRDWVMERSTELLSTEISHVTDRASTGPYPESAKQLRLTSESMKDKLDGFRMGCMEYMVWIV